MKEGLICLCVCRQRSVGKELILTTPVSKIPHRPPLDTELWLLMSIRELIDYIPSQIAHIPI